MNRTLSMSMVNALEYFGRAETGSLDCAGMGAAPANATVSALIRRGMVDARLNGSGPAQVTLTDLGWLELETRGIVSVGQSGFTLFGTSMGATMRINDTNERVSLFASDVTRTRYAENMMALLRKDGSTAIVPESALV